MNDMRSRAAQLLRGSYDLHTHASPSHFPRALDDFQLLRDADRYGMKGIMFKCHYEPTTGRAAIANAHAGTTAKAYGSVALNWPSGGLNPYAAEACLKMGGKMVWMPTLDTELFMSTGKPFGTFNKRPGITVLDADGKVLPVVHAIFDVMLQYDAYLATGHLSAAESLALCKAGRERGVRMILTHPDFARTPIPFAVQAEVAGLGVLVEKVWLNVKTGDVPAGEMADSIRKLGPDRTFLVTDRGQANAEFPAEAMVEAVETMLGCGLSDADIRQLICVVPERILGV